MAQLGLEFGQERHIETLPALAENYVEIDDKRLEITPVFSAYWRFAAERQRIFFKRLGRSNSQVFTDDPILQIYKFTNAYRASDRVSQYLIKNIIYGPKRSSSGTEVFFRILLFKFFNKIETWEYLERTIGPVTFENYNFEKYDNFLTDHIENRGPIYSAAYIMPSVGRKFGFRYKHQNHLKLLEWMIEEGFVTNIKKSNSMSEGYNLLLSAPSIGPFLAYQFITDLNYSELSNYSETEFVVPGPGAIDGISKCFVNAKDVDPKKIIKFMMENQDFYFSKLGEDFENLWGRKLQLIDCQNLFCEISKYSRVAFPNISGVSGRARIKQKFGKPKTSIKPFYPPKWGINTKISNIY